MIESTYPLPPKSEAPLIKYRDTDHQYWIDGISVPSVSELLDSTTPKNALTWWGMRVGIAAAVRLLQEGTMTWPVMAAHVYDEIISGVPVESPQVWRGRGKYRKLKTQIEATILDERLSTNHIKSDAADRGTAIHAASEQIGTLDQIPNIDDFPPEQRGYVQAIARWWLEQQPTFNRQEVIVGSRRLAYAGRFDLDATYPAYGRVLTDYKTSKDVYESHFEQLRLYELAEYELNEYLPEAERIRFDRLAIVHLRPDGEYSMHFADHVSPETAAAVARLSHERRMDAQRLKAGEAVQPQLVP